MKRLKSGLIASWEFLEKHAKRKNGCQDEGLDESFVGKHCERKCAAMAVIKSLEFFPTTITAALSEVTDNLKALLPFGSYHPTSCGNIVHIALLGTNNQMSSLHQRYLTNLFVFSTRLKLKVLLSLQRDSWCNNSVYKFIFYRDIFLC